MRKVYIIAAKRTAIGTFSGTLKDTSAAELGVTVARQVLREVSVEPARVQEVVFGNVLSAGLGQNVTRQIAVRAGLPVETPAFTVNKVCASGMKSIQLAWQALVLGEADLVLAGGVESMNQAPYLLPGARFGLRMNDAAVVDAMVRDGLWCALGNYHMGITAENVAEQYSITRQDQDEFAALSQQKAAAAISDGAFADEIVPVTVKQRGATIEFAKDEHPRPDTTVEVLSKLRPAFKEGGTVTAGNASGINDGAAAVLLASDDFVQAHGIQPVAEVVAFTSVGLSPRIMGMGAASAVRKLIAKVGISLGSVDLFELNEAFASQSVAVVRELGIPLEKLNVNGGGIALGHPIGASGSRILVTLAHALRRRRLELGIAALCVGGGMGMAALVKRCS